MNRNALRTAVAIAAIAALAVLGSGVAAARPEHGSDGSFAFWLGTMVGTLLFPGIGLTLLVIGLRQRSSSKKQPSTPRYPSPQYPGYWPHPQPGPPPQYRPVGPTKPRGRGLIITGSVLLALGLLGFLARAASVSAEKSSGLDVGDCISFTQFSGTGGPSESTDCDDPSAVLELASKGSGGESCPDGNKGDASDYASYTSRQSTLCFALNLHEGSCYEIASDHQSVEPTACETGDLVVRVDKRIDGTTDIAKCGRQSDHAVAFPQPERVLCLSAAV